MGLSKKEGRVVLGDDGRPRRVYQPVEYDRKTGQFVPTEAKPARRGWRKMTWVLLAWCGVFAFWIVAAIHSRPSTSCHADAYLSKSDCIAASDTGTGIAVVAIFGLWFVGFIVLGLVWLMTRRPS